MKVILKLVWILAVSLSSVQAVEPTKDSWPQWGGPSRDHKSLTTGLKQEWPTGGPALLWKMDTAGMGYSSLAVSEGRGYSQGSQDGENFVFCIDVTSGKEIWRVESGAAGKGYNTGWGAGPRGTPTVVNDRVVVLDDAGNCCCLRKDNGQTVWKVNLISDLGGSMPKWGFSESPLVDGQRVVICPGEKNFLTALDLKTGEVVLRSTGYEAAPHYVSVIKHSVGGVEAYTTACGKGLVSFAVDDGRVLWTNSFTGAGTATIPTPIVKDNLVYHTAGYDTGCVLMKLTADGKNVTAEQVWANKNQGNHHGGIVLVNDNVFGFKSKAGWVCQDLATGAVKWESRVAKETGASVAYADGRLYVYGASTGNCYLVEPSASEWSVKGQLALPAKSQLNRGKGEIWTHPVIAEGKLFLRDLDLLYAFDIKK
jgi:outer membrane protein assembly factor BamB